MSECFFWYRPTRVVRDKRPLNGCVCVCVCVCYDGDADAADGGAVGSAGRYKSSGVRGPGPGCRTVDRRRYGVVVTVTGTTVRHRRHAARRGAPARLRRHPLTGTCQSTIVVRGLGWVGLDPLWDRQLGLAAWRSG